MADDECPIVLWNHEDDETQALNPVSQSFESWLIAEILDTFP